MERNHNINHISYLLCKISCSWVDPQFFFVELPISERQQTIHFLSLSCISFQFVEKYIDNFLSKSEKCFI